MRDLRTSGSPVLRPRALHPYWLTCGVIAVLSAILLVVLVGILSDDPYRFPLPLEPRNLSSSTEGNAGHVVALFLGQEEATSNVTIRGDELEEYLSQTSSYLERKTSVQIKFAVVIQVDTIDVYVDIPMLLDDSMSVSGITRMTRLRPSETTDGRWLLVPVEFRLGRKLYRTYDDMDNDAPGILNYYSLPFLSVPEGKALFGLLDHGVTYPNGVKYLNVSPEGLTFRTVKRKG